MPSLRRLIKTALSALLYYGGVVHFFLKLKRWLGLCNVKILAYHGISDKTPYIDLFICPDKFAGQLDYLRRHYRVVSMHEVEYLIRSGAKPSEDLIALTFDDGYRDNYEQAFPRLRSRGLPATIYLTTRCIDTGQPTFVFFLILAIHHTLEPKLDMSANGLGLFELQNHRSREQAIMQIDGYARRLAYDEREHLLDDILSKLRLDRSDPVFQNSMLTWGEVMEMRSKGIEFGAHTVTHPVLANLRPEDAEREIVESKRTIEKSLKTPVNLFAYTYGGRDDISKAIVSAVIKSGFTSAVVLYETPMNSDHIFALGRKMVSDDMTSNVFGTFSTATFACEVSGLFDLIFLRHHKD